MNPEPRRADALQLIFSLFLGVLLVAVVGVGVWTFYPPPFSENQPRQQELQELYREQELVSGKFGNKAQAPSDAEQAEMDRIQRRINDLQREIEEERKPWAVNTSIIVMVFATILMAVSLFLPEAAKVFSNGVLLGGLFSVLYGMGVSFTGGDARSRFWVILVATALSIGIGYLRFIRGRHVAAQPVVTASATASGGPVAAGDVSALADLSQRVAALESRTAAAAAILGDISSSSRE